ncbi:hypothetical protein D3C71_1624570 [compost metagenome]
MGRARGVGRKALVGRPFGVADDLAAKALELAVVAHGDHQRAVGGFEHAVGNDRWVGIAELRRVAVLEQRLHAVVAGDHQAAVVKRHLHMAALAGGVALVQRGEDGLGRVHAGEHVHRGHAELQRTLAFFAVHRHQAGFALHHQVVAGTLGFGA